MRYSETIVEDIKSIIKSEIVRNPGITIDELRSELSKKGHVLERNYIGRMVTKVKHAQLADVRMDTLENRIARTRARFDAAVTMLSKIAYWKWEYISEGIMPPSAGERSMAISIILRQDLALMEAEIVSGIYSKKDPKISDADWRSTMLDPEKRLEIMKALRAVVTLAKKNPSGRIYQIGQPHDAQSPAPAAGSQGQGSLAGSAADSAAAAPLQTS